MMMGEVGFNLMAIVVGMVWAVVPIASQSALLDTFSWEDCGAETTSAGTTPSTPALLQVQTLDVTAPLVIPGQLTIRELKASLSSPLPDDVVIQFSILSNSSFGADYMRTIPCIEQQGGSCVYKLCDFVSLTPEVSTVKSQVLTALWNASLDSQCPLNPVTLSLANVTIDIPSMLHTPLDLFVNTNNYFVTVKLLSGAVSGQVLGCVRLAMPLHKPCQGWLCTHGIDDVISVMHPDDSK